MPCNSGSVSLPVPAQNLTIPMLSSESKVASWSASGGCSARMAATTAQASAALAGTAVGKAK
eukprot:5040309-Lingulodinium_polyedra.AAC.1